MELQVAPKQVQVLSPKMILSMEILQMGTQELFEHIETTVQENPVLETAESPNGYDELQSLSRKMEWLMESDPQNRHYYRQDADFPYPDNAAVEQTKSLYDHVVSQLRSMELEPQLASCTKLLAGCLNNSGWIDEDISVLAEEFNKPLKEVERALAVVQSLEPAGIGARNLSECLCLQLKRRMPVDRLALSIAADHLEPLSKRRYGAIAQALGVSQKDVRQAAEAIRNLDPRPGAAFAAVECAGYMIPDIIVAVFPDHLEPIPNQCFLPSLNISPYYARLMRKCDDETVKNYLSDKVQQAKSMIWAIEQRRNTLLACAGCILEIQEDFFRKGPGHLVPMSLSDVAHRIGIHESTVSRAVRDKYLQCSMGVYPMSHFFVRRLGTAADEAASSPDLAKALLVQLITQEDKHKPLSDQKLCEWMAKRGCTLSRRTVAKYRDELGIPGMSGRKH